MATKIYYRCRTPLRLGVAFGISLVIVITLKVMINAYLFFPVHTLTRSSLPFHPQGALRMSTGSEGGTSSEDFIARDLSRKVKVLVWVMTSPQNLQTKAQAVKETWGRRSNVIIYFSSETDPQFPTVGLNVFEGRNHLTAKTMAAFRYIYENHFNDADWFMKADDDTYIIVENLRYFLMDKNTSQPIYYGHLFKRNIKQGYHSGGSGYVISKEALHRFGSRAINSTLCPEDGGDEDVDFGDCMEKLGVKTSRSLDAIGRSLFHPLYPQIHLLGRYPPWLQVFTDDVLPMGFGVSKYAISFHNILPDDMRTLDYYFYHIRPYGIYSSVPKLNNSKHK